MKPVPAETPRARVDPIGSTLPLLAIAGFASLVSMRLCDAMLPALSAAFAVSTGEAAVVISWYAVMYGVMQLVYGPLGDRFGKPRVIAYAAAWCALTTLAAAAAPTLQVLAIVRGAVGAGAAAIVPLALAWIGDTVPIERRQEVLARYSGATVTGILVGAAAGGFLTETVGWRAAFVVVAPLFVIAFVMLWRNAGATGPTSAPRRKSYANQVRAVLTYPWTRRVFAAVFLEGMFTFGFLAFVPTVMHAKFAMPLTQGGALLALVGLGGLVFSRCSGVLVRRLDPSAQARAGSALLAIGFTLLAWMPNWQWAAVGCAVAGFGFYALHNTLQVNATLLSDTSRGLAVSLFACCFFIGQSVGVPIAALIFTSGEATWGFSIAATALLAVGFGFAHQLRKRELSTAPA